MSDKRATDLTELTTVADDDYLYIVDTSDTTDSSAGSSRKAQAKNVRGWPKTSAETSAGVTVVNYQHEPGNVLRYGATGDGVTDDTTAIQAAITASLAGSYEIYIPAGDYLITSALDLTFSGSSGSGTDTNMYRGVTIRGKSRAHTKIIANTSGDPAFDMTGSRLCQLSSFQVRHDGNDATKPSCAFLLSRNTTNGGSGEHVFRDVMTYGYFTSTAVASISSEINDFKNCSFINLEPNGHGFFLGSQNDLSISSPYISGLAAHSYSGGNTRASFRGCQINNFSTSDGTGRAIFITGDGTSPTRNVLFTGCYSKTEPTAKANSITLDGAVNGICFVDHREESTTVSSVLIASGCTVTGLDILGGKFTRNIYSADTGKITKSFIKPETVTTTLDSGISKYLSFDLYDATYSTFLSTGNNGCRIRNEATGSKIFGTSLTDTDLVLDGSDANISGFTASLKDSSGYIYDYKYGQKARTFEQTVNAKHLVFTDQEITSNGTITPDVRSGSHITVRVSGTTTISNIAGLRQGTLDTWGGVFIITVIQDGTGGHSVSWGSNFDLRGATVSTTADAVTSFMFVHIDPVGAGVNNKFIRIGA